MKYFKNKIKWSGVNLGEAPTITSDPLGELIHASKRMHKDGPISRLFSPLNERELKYMEEQNNVLRKKL